MSKRITPRKLDEINAEYGYLCAQLGEASYRKLKLENSIKAVMNRIDEVSEEATRAGGMQQPAVETEAPVEQTPVATEGEAA